MKTIALLVMLLGFVTACTSADKRDGRRHHDSAKMSDARHHDGETSSPRHDGDGQILLTEVVTFERGSHRLPDSAARAIRQLVDRAERNGGIQDVEIAVWSDRDLPLKNDLSRAQQELAAKRILAISRYFNSVGVAFVDSYNMAERSNWLARMMGGSEAELKSSYAKAGGSHLNDEELQLIKRHGSPSKAVIVVHQNDDK